MALTALDTETCLIEAGARPPELVLIQLRKGGGPVEYWSPRDSRVVGRLRDALRGKVLGHNLPFDLTVLRRRFPELSRDIYDACVGMRLVDTYYREQIIQIATEPMYVQEYVRSPSLAQLVEKYCGVTLEKDRWRLRFGEWVGLNPEDMPPGAVDYGGADVLYLHRIVEAQGEPDWMLDAYRQTAYHVALEDMRYRGMPVCIPTWDRAVRRRQLLTPMWERKLTAAGIMRSNGTVDRRKLQDHVCALTQHPPMTEKGQVSISMSDCLAAGVDSELLRTYWAYQYRARYELQNVLLGMEKFRGTVQPRYSLATTGRAITSSPNLQNVPQHLRKVYAAPPGWVLVSEDYTGLELHTWAQWCRDKFGVSVLGDELAAGRDGNTAVAALLLGVDYDQYDPGNPEHKRFRSYAKVLNYARMGGGGVARVSKQTGLSEAETRRVMRHWESRLPEATKHLQWAQAVSSYNGMVHLPRTGMRSICRAYCQVANRPFQGLGAAVSKLACLYLFGEVCSGRIPAGGGALFVHDEIIGCYPEEIGHECAQLQHECMHRAAVDLCPDNPPPSEPAMMRVWSKKASPRVHDGRLVPWDA